MKRTKKQLEAERMSAQIAKWTTNITRNMMILQGNFVQAPLAQLEEPFIRLPYSGIIGYIKI